MTDSAVTVTQGEPTPLWRLEIWRGEDAVRAALPAAGRAVDRGYGRIRWIEPDAWLSTGDGAAFEALLGQAGAVFDVSSALTRVELRGPGARALLMISGVFDAESPAFAAGSTAATVIDHVSVWLDMVGEEAIDAYVPASYGADMLAFWQTAASRAGET